MQEKPSIRANAVHFNQKTGIGTITIHGHLALNSDVDDPVIEIWNAVQHKMQTAVKEQKGGKLIHFTPLFPKYNEEKDITVYDLVPTRYEGVTLKDFTAEAKITIDVFYKKLFIASFSAFLEDGNKVFNYNGYTLYRECIKRISSDISTEKRQEHIATTKMLLANFINYLGLPLPESKKKLAKSGTILYDIKALQALEIPV